MESRVVVSLNYKEWVTLETQVHFVLKNHWNSYLIYSNRHESNSSNLKIPPEYTQSLLAG